MAKQAKTAKDPAGQKKPAVREFWKHLPSGEWHWYGRRKDEGDTESSPGSQLRRLVDDALERPYHWPRDEREPPVKLRNWLISTGKIEYFGLRHGERLPELPQTKVGAALKLVLTNIWLHEGGILLEQEIFPVQKVTESQEIVSYSYGDPRWGLAILLTTLKRIDDYIRMHPPSASTPPPAPADQVDTPRLPSRLDPMGELEELSILIDEQDRVRVEAFNKKLEELAGWSYQAVVPNHRLAVMINRLASDSGIRLLFDGKPVTLQFVRTKKSVVGTFQVCSADAAQTVLHSSPACPRLTAARRADFPAARRGPRPKQGAEKKSEPREESA